jgi:hypothetical protein
MSEIEVLKAELAIANDRAKKMEERAQVLFKEADFFMRACDAQKARAEAAEKERDYCKSEMLEARAYMRVETTHAEDAEKRAEAAEKREAALREALTDIEKLSEDGTAAKMISRAALEAKP